MTELIEQDITLKSVNDLCLNDAGEPLHFFIPAYQRGYRWSPIQVKQLLEDIYEFLHRRNPQPDEFYCLQPLVIKTKAHGVFEVVDGQQRLTTLMLILRHFNERSAKKYQKIIFTISYETRPSLEGFLEEPTQDLANEYADYSYIFDAIQTIQNWFEKRESEVGDINSTLLNKTKVIWFQLADSDDPVGAFTRLNIGKIPLTNDELIRALFLRCKGLNEKDAINAKIRIAYEWDQLEKALQSDAFWYFLRNDKGKEQNRIGFLFDLVAREDVIPPEYENDAYCIFYIFNDRIKNPGANSETEWDKIKEVYQILDEWFEDRWLYHMVGFLVNERVSLSEIRLISINCTKKEFRNQLRQKIFKQAIGEDLADYFDEPAVSEAICNLLDELSYEKQSDRPRIRAVLLLFNLATLLQNSNSNIRFQFDRFKDENWDIEHVRSVTNDKPERFHERKDWLDNCLRFLKLQNEGDDLIEDIELFLTLTQIEATNERFDPLYEKVLEYFNENSSGEVENGISNLALLDAGTNRSYKNGVFAVKRQRLLNLDKAGIFVPLCTRNVFLKCYSPQVGDVIFWTQEDQKEYWKEISSVLVNFFCGKMEGNQ